MSVVDVKHKTITLKVVYYGCALGGKTTNLQTLHRLTDPEGRHGLLSIATKDDRTLFFDLLPMELGQVNGLAVRVKVYTVPGQVHYELTRRQVLGAADGVVLVIDSSPDAKKPNSWAVENLRHNLKVNGLQPDQIPTVLQWNKRDLPEARPVSELQAELNPRGLHALEAVATSGAGVVGTFCEIVTRTIVSSYEKAGRPVAADVVARKVDQALGEAREREPVLTQAGRAAAGAEEPAASAAFMHRVDMESYHENWAERGHDRQVMDQEALLTESVQASMELAERLDGMKRVQAVNERRAAMLGTLARVAPMLLDPAVPALPDGVMKLLVEGSCRRRGSLLLFQGGSKTMTEREVVPADRDLLNSTVAENGESVAFRISRQGQRRWIEDLGARIELDEASKVLLSAYVVPLGCDGTPFGGLLVYAELGEPSFDDADREYWDTASALVSLSLHWKVLRQKLIKLEGGAATAAGA